MQHRLAVGLLAAGLLIGASAAPASSGPRVEERSYTASPVITCGETVSALPSGSGACYDLQPDDTVVSFVVDDDHSEAVSARVTFYRPFEDQIGLPFNRIEPIGTTSFCTASGEIDIPTDATTATITLYGASEEAVGNAYPTLHAAAGSPEGAPGSSPSPCGLGTGATSGTIVAEFS